MSTKTALEHFDEAAETYEMLTGGSTRELARYLLDLTPDIYSSSTILDNACGPAVLTDELLSKLPKDVGPPTINAVDGSPRMIDLARKRLGILAEGPVSLGVMPAERLEFHDNTFTHSFTNQGILFFSQPEEAAKEIYRTLKPGGISIVTSWAHLGSVDVIRKSQAATKPDAPLYTLPIGDAWLSDDHVKKVLENGGFKSVETHHKDVYMAANTFVELRDLLHLSFSFLVMNWSDNEKAQFKNVMLSFVQDMGKEIPSEGGAHKVGIRMTAIVAVARK